MVQVPNKPRSRNEAGFYRGGIRSAGIRDVAIVGLLYGFGLRRSELVRLDATDIHAGDGVLTIQGKGNELRNEDQLCAADSVSTLAIPHGHTRFAPEDVIWRTHLVKPLVLPKCKLRPHSALSNAYILGDPGSARCCEQK